MSAKPNLRLVESTLPAFDLEAARNFTGYLDPTTDKFHFSVLNDRSKERESWFEHYGTLDELAADLRRLNLRGGGVYITVNRTDGSGKRRRRNLTTARALWIEHDNGLPDISTYALPPSITVLTSKVGDVQKGHRYWLIDFDGEEPNLTFDEQERMLEGMAEKHLETLDGVGSYRLLRVPGFFHMKREPQLVTMEVHSDNDEAPIYAPSALRVAFPPKTKNVFAVLDTPVDYTPDDPQEVARFQEKLDTVPGSVAGDRHAKLMRLAAEAGDYGIHPEMAIEILAPWGNKCDPPLDVAADPDFIDRAYDSRQNSMGCRTARAEFDDIRHLLANDQVTSAPTPAPAPPSSKPLIITPQPYKWRDPASIPPRDWLYDQHLIRKFLSATAAPGGLGKSSLKFVELISMAIGRSLLTGKEIKRLKVWVWNGEDPMDELDRRVAAVCKHYGVTETDLGDRFDINSGRETKLCIARETKTGVVIEHPVREALTAAIQQNGIDVFMVDPFIRSHQVSESDNNAIDIVADQYREIAEAANCAIELVHHVRKHGGAEITVEDARGASALKDATRSFRVLNPMTAEEAKFAMLANPELRRSLFRICDGKQNMAPPAESSRWIKLESVALGNGRPGLAGDHVGVATAWQWPEAADGLPEDAFEKVRPVIAGGSWRESVQSPSWVGYAIAQALDLDIEFEKERIKQLIKTWRSEGRLKVVQAKDSKRETKDFIEVVEGAAP